MAVRGKGTVTRGSGGGGREIYLLSPQVNILAIGNKYKVMSRHRLLLKTQTNVHKVGRSEYLRSCKRAMTWRYPVHGCAGYLVGSCGVFGFFFLVKSVARNGYDICTPRAGNEDIKTVGTRSKKRPDRSVTGQS